MCIYNFFVFNKGITLHLFFLITVLRVEKKILLWLQLSLYAVDYHIYIYIYDKFDFSTKAQDHISFFHLRVTLASKH